MSFVICLDVSLTQRLAFTLGHVLRRGRFYHVVEFSSLAFAVLATYFCAFKFAATYDHEKDAFGNFQVALKRDCLIACLFVCFFGGVAPSLDAVCDLRLCTGHPPPPRFVRAWRQVPPQFGVLFLVLPCFALACVLHPNLNKDFLSDMAWTFSM
jgi:hypothetical protein